MAQAARALVKPRVIVVMDDPLAKVLEVVLQHGRYESRVATEPAKVLELLRDPVPHIVLMDLDAYPGLRPEQKKKTAAIHAAVVSFVPASISDR